MKKLLMILGVLILAAPVWAQCPGQSAPAVPVCYQRITVSTTALSLTCSTGNAAPAYSASADYVVGNIASSGGHNYLTLAANGASSSVKAVSDTAYWRLLEDNDPNMIAAYVTLETAPLRFTTNGTTPTSAIGHYFDSAGVNPALLICGKVNIQAFRAIRQGSSDASITVTYYDAR
jgi:hypothetical protein